MTVSELIKVLNTLAEPEREILIEDYDDSCIYIKGVTMRLLLPSGKCFYVIEMAE